MHIIIIGAGPGISAGVARKFGREGFRVSIVGRNESKLKDECAQLSSAGIQANYAVADVSVQSSLDHALAQLQAADADVIHFNPSASVYKSLAEESWDNMKAQLDVNAGGAFFLLQKMLPVFLRKNSGLLMFTGGGLSLQPSAQMVGLSMGKAALRSLVLAMMNSLKETQVRIGMVTVCGMVDPKDAKYNPDAIAEQFWHLYKGNTKTDLIY